MSTQTALVWGAAGGIGRALTHRLVADKWQVVSLGRHTETLQDLTPYVFECEVTDPFAVQRTVIAAGQEVSEASLFVYSVGDITSATLAIMPPAAWERIIGANLTGAFLTAHYCLPLLADDAPLCLCRRSQRTPAFARPGRVCGSESRDGGIRRGVAQGAASPASAAGAAGCCDDCVVAQGTVSDAGQSVVPGRSCRTHHSCLSRRPFGNH